MSEPIHPGNERWYITGPNGKHYGPYPFQAMRSAVAQGKLKPDSRVLADGESNWVAASTIPGLFAPADAAPTPPATPPVAPTAPPPIPQAPRQQNSGMFESCLSGMISAIATLVLGFAAAGLFLYGLANLLGGETRVIARDSQLLGLVALLLVLGILQLIVLIQSANTLFRIEKRFRQ